MDYSNQAIGFAPNLVPLVKNGTKTFTYRIGPKYEFLEVGDIISVKDSSTQEVFSKVEVTEKSFTTFSQLPTSRDGHESYQSKEEQRQTFKKYYGKEISDDEKIIVIGFKICK